MHERFDHYLQRKIDQRKDDGNYRSLKQSGGLIDFTSNDYLGFARDGALSEAILNEISRLGDRALGSTGSRLLTGHNDYIEGLEKSLAEFHRAEDALIFNSGFDANYGLLSSLPYKNDLIIYDEMVHASIHDGMRNSKASSIAFAHNDLGALEQTLMAVPSTGLKYLVVESLYSMEGDFAPLLEIAALCERHSAALIVDEAHANGVYGEEGRGLVCALGLEQQVFARIHTFSKALGAHGAVLLCSAKLKEFLLNYCRPLIFSTALPFFNLAAIKCAYAMLPQVEERRVQLLDLIRFFREQCKEMGGEMVNISSETSPVQSLVISGNREVREVSSYLQSEGFDIRPIRYPTVPKSHERIRVCIHSFNTKEELTQLSQSLTSVYARVA